MSRLNAYHTPNEITGTTIVRVIVVPVDFLPHVGGALGELLEPENWEQVGVSVEDSTEEMYKMIDYYYNAYLVGQVAFFASDNLPVGWVALHGQVLDSAEIDYPELWAACPNLIDGTTIVLPDARNRFLIADGDLYALGDVGGNSEVDIEVGNLPPHNHTYTPPAVNPDVEGPGIPDIGATVLGPPGVTGSTGDGDPLPILNPYLSLTAAIFIGRVYP